MTQSRPISSGFRPRLGLRQVLLATASVALFSTPGPLAHAQETSSDDGDLILVTGSRIPRQDIVANSPITIVGQEEFEFSGNPTVERVLNQLPQVVPGASSQSNNPGAGFATIDLRGLGNQRTLALVNGRRWIPADNSSGFGGVDLNTIPSGLIERVEVVTGGASAVYGSDAIAGVVNFITKDDFEGVQADAQFDLLDEGDGETYNFSILAGTNFDQGRGNVTFYTEYYTQTQVLAAERDFTFFDCDDGAGDLAGRGDFTCGPPGGDGRDALRRGGSSRIPEGRISGGGFTLPDGTTTGSILFLPDGNARARSGVTDVFNFAPFTNIQVPLDRISIASTFNYDVTETVEVYGEATFVNTTSQGRLAPTPLAEAVDISVDINPFLTEEAKDIIRSSANYDPATGVYSGSLFRRMLESGAREQDFKTNAFRFVGGARGEFGDFFGGWISDWTWDVYYMFGRTELTDVQNGNIQLSRAQQGLLLEQAPDGSIVCQNQSNGCVPLNFFGEGNFTQDMVDFATIQSLAVGTTQTEVVAGTLAGDMFELPSGPVQVAGGFEYREESADFTPDPVAASGDIDGFNAAGNPLDGSFNVWELFMETRIPVVTDLPFAQLVAIDGGVRYSDYSTVGRVVTFKGGGEWEVDDQLRVRGLFQRAIRAPNIIELFGPQINGFPQVDDFCDSAQNPVSSGLADLCIATGVPADNYSPEALAINPEGTFTQEDSQIEAILGGNPDLEEETSNTWTVGFVLQPNVLENFSLTVDWYNIRLENAIAQSGGSTQGVFDLCAVSNSANSFFCSSIPRRGDGNAEGVLSLNENVSSFETNGLDVSVNYAFDLDGVGLDNAGNISLFGTFGYVNEWILTPTEFSDPVECAGRFGGNCGQTFAGYPTPDMRSFVRATWSRGPVQLSARWRWTGGLEDVNQDAAIPDVDGRHYLDLTAIWQPYDNLSFRLGAENVLSTEPPRVGNSQTDSNTLVPLFDVLGARIFLGASVEL